MKSFVEAVCTAPLCREKNFELVPGSAPKRGSVGDLQDKCMRCGGCGHAHGDCISAKPTWGIDWRKYRERRRHRRRVRRPEKKRGDEGVKAHRSGRSVNEALRPTGASPMPAVAVAEERTTTIADGGAVSDADWVEVIRRPRGVQKRRLRETGGSSADEAEKLSNGGHLKEVGETVESERGKGEPRHEERLKEVA